MRRIIRDNKTSEDGAIKYPAIEIKTGDFTSLGMGTDRSFASSTKGPKQTSAFKQILSKLTGFRLLRRNTAIVAQRENTSPNHDNTGEGS